MEATSQSPPVQKTGATPPAQEGRTEMAPQRLSAGPDSARGDGYTAEANPKDETRAEVRLELTRQELLAAIDFEIAQREGANSRHGVTIWAIIIALGGLFWSSLLELTERNHSVNTLLTLVLGYWLLTTIAPFFTSKLRWFPTMKPPADRATFKSIALASGLEPSLLPLHMLEALSLGLACWILVKHEFHAFWAGVALFAVYFLILAFGALLFLIGVPLRSQASPIPRFWEPAFVLCFQGLNFSWLSLAVWTLIQAWPNLPKEDVRLGCMLAGFAFAISFSVTFTRRPTGLTELRGLRSRLAFGLVDIGAARVEAESILLGPPRESYLTRKADAVIWALGESERLSSRSAEKMGRVIYLSECLRAKPGDKGLIEEAALEVRGLLPYLIKNLKQQDAWMTRAVKLRAELGARAKVAMFLMDMPVAQVKAILSRVDLVGRKCDCARASVASCTERFITAGRHLSDAVKGHPLSQGHVLNYRELITALRPVKDEREAQR